MNNEYKPAEGEEYDEENEKGPPMPLDLKKVERTILADKPRVTRFQINWGDLSEEEQQQQQQQQQEQESDVAMSFGGTAAAPQDAPVDTAMISAE